MPLNLRQLEAFRAVMLAKTVTRAAQMLFVSQPAVTRLIGDLERHVGFALFERRKGRLHPTPEGLALYEEVDKSFVGVEKIARTAQEIREFRSGSLVVAGLPALSLSFLPGVVKCFLEEHPGVTVSLQVRSSQKVVEWLASQQCDVGLVAMEVDDPAVEKELLLHTEMVCVLPPGHRLAARAMLTPADLAGEVFVSLGPENGTRFRVDSAFEQAGAQRRLQVETQLSAAACDLVLAGAGVSIVEPVTAGHYVDRGLVVRPFEPSIPFRFTLLYPAHRPRSRITREFVKLLRSLLEAEFPQADRVA